MQCVDEVSWWIDVLRIVRNERRTVGEAGRQDEQVVDAPNVVPSELDGCTQLQAGLPPRKSGILGNGYGNRGFVHEVCAHPALAGRADIATPYARKRAEPRH